MHPLPPLTITVFWLFMEILRILIPLLISNGNCLIKNFVFLGCTFVHYNQVGLSVIEKSGCSKDSWKFSLLTNGKMYGRSVLFNCKRSCNERFSWLATICSILSLKTLISNVFIYRMSCNKKWIEEMVFTWPCFLPCTVFPWLRRLRTSATRTAASTTTRCRSCSRRSRQWIRRTEIFIS